MDDLISLISNIDIIIKTGGDLLSLVQQAKGFLCTNQSSPQMMATPPQSPMSWGMPMMNPFVPQMADPFQGGAQFIPWLTQLAEQNGNAWVPTQTMPLFGLNLTGIWCPPMNPTDQTYIRQYGPYLNVIAGLYGTPTFFGEGLFNIQQCQVHVVGRYLNGSPMEARAQLFPNWMMQGMMTIANPFGMPMQSPLFMGKVA